MGTGLSILPSSWDTAYFLKLTGVTNHFGFDEQDDGIHFKYLGEDYDAVIQAVNDYPTKFATDVMKPAMYADIANKRTENINGFTFNGSPIPMDPESRSNLVGAVVGLQRNPDVTTIHWKVGPGQYMALDAATIEAIADSAFKYVEGCFDHEKDLASQIAAAADIYELAKIDTSLGWPAYPGA